MGVVVVVAFVCEPEPLSALAQVGSSLVAYQLAGISFFCEDVKVELNYVGSHDGISRVQEIRRRRCRNVFSPNPSGLSRALLVFVS